MSGMKLINNYPPPSYALMYCEKNNNKLAEIFVKNYLSFSLTVKMKTNFYVHVCCLSVFFIYRMSVINKCNKKSKISLFVSCK